jgi:hypothetical protein
LSESNANSCCSFKVVTKGRGLFVCRTIKWWQKAVLHQISVNDCVVLRNAAWRSLEDDFYKLQDSILITIECISWSSWKEIEMAVSLGSVFAVLTSDAVTSWRLISSFFFPQLHTWCRMSLVPRPTVLLGHWWLVLKGTHSCDLWPSKSSIIFHIINPSPFSVHTYAAIIFAESPPCGCLLVM